MYEFTGRIRYSETDENSVLRIPALFDYFQDCSTFQSEALNVGVEYLKELGAAWVLNSWQIDITRLPKLCEEVIIGTFPYSFTGFLGCRNFYMKTVAGEELAKANSVWSLINLISNRPVKPTQEMLDGYRIEERLDMEYTDRKILLDGNGTEREPIEIKEHHLDSNHHVNNSQYVKLAMDFLPTAFNLQRIRVEYKKAAFLHDLLRPLVYEGESKLTVAFMSGDNKVYSSIEFSKFA